MSMRARAARRAACRLKCDVARADLATSVQVRYRRLGCRVLHKFGGCHNKRAARIGKLFVQNGYG